MIKRVLIDNKEIEKLTAEKNFAEAARHLLNLQKSSWKKLGDGYKSLRNVKTKFFEFDGYTFKIQFNPGRIISSSAKVDERSIIERVCFLCYRNLPSEQKGILYDERFLILGNPYPIFPEHLTAAHVEHIPQRIKGSFSDLFALSKVLSEFYTVIYNGPKCGASAPDHLHFQAGSPAKGGMPLNNEFQQIRNKYEEILSERKNLIVAVIDDGLRRFISIESDRKEKVEKIFRIFYEAYEKVTQPNTPDEPMLNILSIYEKISGWRVIIFLRAKHRSSHYFEEGEKNILYSPASVDLGGVCITPLEKDFNKIDKQLLTEIFREVTLGKEKFEHLKLLLKENIK